MKLMHSILIWSLCLGLQAVSAYAAGEGSKETSKQERQATQTPIVVTEIWTVYLDRLEKEAVTVNFSKGSSELSASDQAKLRELVPAWQKSSHRFGSNQRGCEG